MRAANRAAEAIMTTWPRGNAFEQANRVFGELVAMLR